MFSVIERYQCKCASYLWVPSSESIGVFSAFNRLRDGTSSR